MRMESGIDPDRSMIGAGALVFHFCSDQAQAARIDPVQLRSPEEILGGIVRAMAKWRSESGAIEQFIEMERMPGAESIKIARDYCWHAMMRIGGGNYRMQLSLSALGADASIEMNIIDAQLISADCH